MNAGTPETRSANDLAVERTDLATQRTVMAADRNLMAWIRTALSMISFGFTIYKLLQGFHAAGEALPRENTPRNIGLFLTALGTVSMVLGCVEYLGVMKEMRRHQHVRYLRPAFGIALVMSVCGLTMFFVIFLKVL
ncbi:MAG TPA: DUF202 domain-containing protein [Candidatus Eisenbacteria bacterium]